MRTYLGLVVALAVAVLSAGPAAAETVPQIVLQSVAGPPEVAAWSPDDRFLATARASTRELLVWDVASGDIVNRILLPSQGDYVQFAAMVVGRDVRTVRLQFAIAPPTIEDPCRAVLYTIDLATREVVEASSTALLDPCLPEDFTRTALKLPNSHKARLHLSILPTASGLTLVAQNSNDAIVQTFAKPQPLSPEGAAMALDGRRLALLDVSPNGKSTQVEVFDLATAEGGAGVSLTGSYRSAAWLDDRRLLLSSGNFGVERYSTVADLAPGADETPYPDTVVDAASGARQLDLPQRCYTAALGGERFIGAGLANCTRYEYSTDRVLQVFEGGAWKPFALTALDGWDIDEITVSPDRQTIFLALSKRDGRGGGSSIVRLIRASDGAVIATADFADQSVHGAVYAEDGKSMLIATYEGTWVWPAGAAAPTPLASPANTQSSAYPLIAGDGAQLFHSAQVSDQVIRIDRDTGAELPPLDVNGVIAGGFLPGGRVFWTVSQSDGISLWDRRDWHRIATTSILPGRHFVTVTPDGRYDTDLGPDDNQFRWWMADAPFQSLPAQTFMRDYFEPRLAGKLLGCTAAGDCATAFPPLPSLASLNRVLPKLAITGVVPGERPGTLKVTVNGREGVDPKAANGKIHSGLYNVRLFRDGRLIMQYPDAVYREQEARVERSMSPSLPFDQRIGIGTERDPEAVQQAIRNDVKVWRELNLIAEATGDKDIDLIIEVEVPTSPGTETATFSAYGFNSDRVKSETASLRFTRGTMPAVPPRAFVLTIGIDAYDDPRLQLNFAANDAALMADRLSAIPGYTMHSIDLRAAKDPAGKPRRVTREVLEIVLSTLAGGDPGVGRQYLAEQGFDGAALDVAHPDDLVIITYSGHGYTDPRGNFFLLPSDAKLDGSGEIPVLASLFSATNLAVYLSSVKAGEIALVIDACHSAASVDSNGFKPGPMGDQGLGQLAFDKGIRVLAASQSDDVALESDKLRQGLLTYALASEGLSPDGARADGNGDGAVTMDEWLRYGAARLPGLSADLTAGRPISGARGVVFLDGAPAQAKVQQPALFDFTGKASPVVLNTRP